MNLRHAMDVYRGYRVPTFRLVETRRVWFAFSGLLIAVSLVGLFGVRLSFSIDFEGGARVVQPLRSEATVEDFQAVLAAHDLEGEVQIVEGERGRQVAIRTGSLAALPDQAALIKDLADVAGIDPAQVSVEDIGPTWGAQISRKAAQGLVIVLVLISFYIAWRFESAMAVGAMVALVHDMVITAGVYALTGREVTPETVIAILTILGFSLYDTVVIYDKVKENTESAALVARMGYGEVVNVSLNQTLMRSVNTSLVVLLPIASLLLFGGETLKDFAFAMLVGVAIGAYSSIFVAAPVLTIIKGRQLGRKPQTRRPGARPPAPSRAAAAAEARVAEDAAAVGATARQGGGGRPRPRSKKRSPAKRKRR